MYIYVLYLKYGKYFIGKTLLNPEFSFENIVLELKNCAWVRKYPPVALSEFFACPCLSDSSLVWKTLDLHVLKYMNQYGILQVRGGSFSNVIFENHQIVFLKKNMNRYGNGVFCVICGSRSHMDENCSKLVCQLGSLCGDGQPEYDMIEKLKSNCGRCGRFGHETGHCISIIHQNGFLICLPSK